MKKCILQLIKQRSSCVNQFTSRTNIWQYKYCIVFLISEKFIYIQQYACISNYDKYLDSIDPRDSGEAGPSEFTGSDRVYRAVEVRAGSPEPQGQPAGLPTDPDQRPDHPTQHQHRGGQRGPDIRPGQTTGQSPSVYFSKYKRCFLIFI
jgi:hypothetical protein